MGIDTGRSTLATSNSNADALQSQIALMEKTLEEKERAKAELEKEKNQAKCGTVACATMCDDIHGRRLLPRGSSICVL